MEIKASIIAKLSIKSKKTLEALMKKATASFSDKVRMPSIQSIHVLFTELGIKHYFGTSQNTVEYRSAGKRYVNSRHMGKCGYSLRYDDHENRGNDLNTSDSYYSANSRFYARNILEYLATLN